MEEDFDSLLGGIPPCSGADLLRDLGLDPMERKGPDLNTPLGHKH